MVEAIACFFLISFPLAVWAFFAVAKRIYRNRPDDGSFLGRLLAGSGTSPLRDHREGSSSYRQPDVREVKTD
jgi:hypothetical protein